MKRYWDDAAVDAVKDIVADASNCNDLTLLRMRQHLDSMISSTFHKGNTPVADWLRLGALAYGLGRANGLVQGSEDEYIATTAHFIAGKQRDYGPKNVSRFGSQGLLVRAHDKVARLEHLTATKAGPANESLADTITDLVGYACVATMWERKEFLIPLDPDRKMVTVVERIPDNQYLVSDL